MGQYRKLPVVIEAVKWTGKNLVEIKKFCPRLLLDENAFLDILIPAIGGNVFCYPGDFVVKGVKGEYYPCKPDIFEQTHVKVN